jgi:hypothetical protein
MEVNTEIFALSKKCSELCEYLRPTLSVFFFGVGTSLCRFHMHIWIYKFEHEVPKYLLPHCNEIPIYIFTEKELRGLSQNFHIHVSVSDLYIPRIGPHIILQQNRHTNPRNIWDMRHECRNWDWGRAIPFLGVFISNFRYCVFAVRTPTPPTVDLYI